jgi:RND superfamily putative drug exporter
MRDLPSIYLRHRRAWIVAVVMLFVGGAIIGLGQAGRQPSATDTLARGSDSATVATLQQLLPQGSSSSAIVLYTADSGTLSPAQIQTLNATYAAEVAASGSTPMGPPTLTVSADGTAALGIVPISAEGNAENSAAIADLRQAVTAQAPAGVAAVVTGPAAVQADLGAVFQGADTRLLLVTAGVVAFLLLITYRSPILWLVPLITVGIADQMASVIATHALNWFNVRWDESTVGILSVLVFGAGTDYALLLISRYRDELKRVDDRYEAMTHAVRRTGEAVIASATTVILGVLTLLLSLFPTTRGLGASSAIGIVVAVGFALVVLPSVLVLFGRWIFWPLVPRVGQGQLVDGRSLWRRVGDTVARRPSVFIAGTLILLAGLSLGIPQIKSGLSPSDQFLKQPESIAAAQRLAQSFPAGNSDPVVVITRGDAQAVVGAAESVAGVDRATVANVGDGLTQVDVVLDGAGGTTDAAAAVRDLRSVLSAIPQTYVGGTEAQSLDAASAASRDRWVIMPLILALVFVALVLLLRSLVAPIILVATVVGTYLAALGAAWWVFTGIFGFEALDVTAPLTSFLFLVALGVDYNIFLVTRAREESPDHGSREGMLRGLAATGGVITSAGILLAAVFAVLGILPLVVLAQIGAIICIGVLLDTLVVRTVLVPAIGVVLADRFWWPRRVAATSSPATGDGSR